jgi:catechol 2,3-dioxygenase-like lactoylglutathione lyase family enzyme
MVLRSVGQPPSPVVICRRRLMADRVEFQHFNHMNQIVPEYRDAIDHYTTNFGAQFLYTVASNPHARACLMNFGGAVFEYVAPQRAPYRPPADRTSFEGTFWYSRGPAAFVVDYPNLGGHFAGLEYNVKDRDGAFETMAAKGLRLIDEREWSYFLTYADQCHGISLEIYDLDWYSGQAMDWYVEPMKDAAYWRDEHPLGITSFRYSVAVKDLDAAVEFYADLCGAKERYVEDRPSAGAKAVGLEMDAAGMIVDFLTPTGDGPVNAFLERYDDRIRAMVFEVADIEAVRRYFRTKGIALISGDSPGALAVDPRQNLGCLYEFVESRE